MHRLIDGTFVFSHPRAVPKQSKSEKVKRDEGIIAGIRKYFAGGSKVCVLRKWYARDELIALFEEHSDRSGVDRPLELRGRRDMPRFEANGGSERRAVKLFHCVVVMGAAMGNGCGGETGAGNGAPRDAGDSKDATWSATIWPDTGIVLPNCTAATACFSTCPGPADAPHTAQDCPLPAQFRCDGAACGCDPGAPLSPADCPVTAQFWCSVFSPACGCYCNLEAGIDPAACCGDAAVQEGGPCVDYGAYRQWSCTSYDPPVGCDCRRLVIAIL